MTRKNEIILSKIRRVLSAFLVALFFFGASGACSQSDQSAISRKPQQGVTDTEILLGSSLALTGYTGYLGQEALHGTLCYIRWINENGGIHGRTLRLITYDDAYDPPVCLANTQKLIVEDRVFALFSYLGTPTTLKILPLVENAGIPLIAPLSGANAFREPFNPWVINVRASYYQETEAAVRHLVEDLGIRNIAVLYQCDAYGFDGLTGTELALRKFHLTPVARSSYLPGTSDVEGALERIAASGAGAVVMIGTYEPCVRFISLAQERGFHPVFYGISFIGAERLAQRLDGAFRGTVILSQVAPSPEHLLSQDAPDNAATSYIDLMKRYFPEEAPTFVGFEGFINAVTLVEGLKRAGRNPTRESLIHGIESIRDYPLGPDTLLSFSATDHQGMDRVYFTYLENDSFIPVKNWSVFKESIGRSVIPGNGP